MHNPEETVSSATAAKRKPEQRTDQGVTRARIETTAASARSSTNRATRSPIVVRPTYDPVAGVSVDPPVDLRTEPTIACREIGAAEPPETIGRLNSMTEKNASVAN